MIDPELLEILACPETHQPLQMADPELLAALNATAEAGDDGQAAAPSTPRMRHPELR